MSAVEAYLDRLLSRFANAWPAPGPKGTAQRKLSRPLTFWDGAEPFASGVPGFDAFVKEAGINAQFFEPGEVKPRDIDRLDVSCVVNMNEEPEDRGFGLARYRRATPEMTRGKTVAFAPEIVEATFAIFQDSGGYDCVRYYFGGGKNDFTGWKDLTKDAVGHKDLLQRLIFAYGVQFTRDMNWNVTLGYENTPSLSFITDPVGAREVFALRDIPEGKARRAALLHWVKDHWRRKRKDDAEASILVQQHLRGAQAFVWNEMRCTIQPSRDDLKRLAAKKGKT